MFESISKFWEETMEIPEARWIIWLTLLVIFVMVGGYVAMYFRGQAKGIAQEPTDYLSDFQKLKDEGKLDEEEFGRLKQAIPKHPLLEDDDQVKENT